MSPKLSELNPDALSDLVPEMGYSLVSNLISIQGLPVRYMYREKPVDKEDSGWRFLSGTESQDWIDDDSNSKYLSVNTVANLDPAIIPYVRNPLGTELERLEGSNEFIPVED